MCLVEFSELLERVLADDVRVEDKEWGVVFSEDLLGEFEGTGGAEGFCLDGEFDADVVFLFVLGAVLGQRFLGSQVNTPSSMLPSLSRVCNSPPIQCL